MDCNSHLQIWCDKGSAALLTYHPNITFKCEAALTTKLAHKQITHINTLSLQTHKFVFFFSNHT